MDQTTDLDTPATVSLAMAAVLPELASNQASFVDAWQVQVSRSGQGVIAQESGTVGPEQSTISVQISVTLESSCENLVIRVELSSEGQVWFRSNENHEVCAGTGNQLQAQELEWVRPSPTVSVSNEHFILQEGRSSSRNFSINYAGTDSFTWTVSVLEGNAGWLTLQPTSGSAALGQPGQVTITANATGLTAGEYSAHIIVSSEGFPDLVGEIPVSLTVTAGPRIELYPLEPLAFSVLSGVNPSPQAFTITNSGGGTLQWSATDNVGWLSVTPSSGSLGAGQSRNVSVSVAGASLEPGDYQATITVRDPEAGNSPQTLSVNLVVRQRAMIGLGVPSLSFTAQQGTDAWEQNFSLANVGGSTLNWTATWEASWLIVEPNSGTLWYIPGAGGTATSVRVRVQSADLDAGIYQSYITFSDPEAGNSPQILPVTLTVTPQSAPVISKLAATLVTINDKTCWNNGSRFAVNFDYSDADGDVLIAVDSLSGTPIDFAFHFLPDGNSGSAPITAAVDGTGFLGTVQLELCIAYEVPENTNLMISFSLRDGAGLPSNTLVTYIPRPVGGNSPTQLPGAQSSGGSLTLASPGREGGEPPPLE